MLDCLVVSLYDVLDAGVLRASMFLVLSCQGSLQQYVTLELPTQYVAGRG